MLQAVYRVFVPLLIGMLGFRLCTKLQAFKEAGQPVEMEEEFRILTLQIIGEAFLSLPPDESDRVSLNPSM